MVITWGVLAVCVIALVFLAKKAYFPSPAPISGPDWAPNFPAVRLEEVCGPGDYEYADYNHKWTMTATEIDTLHEEGAAENEAEVGRPSLYTTSYRMPFAWLAPHVLESYLGFHLFCSQERLDTALVDEAWLLRDQGNDFHQMLVVREGRYLVELDSNTGAQIADALPALAEKLDAAE